MDIHASIQDFLQQRSIAKLADGAVDTHIKAGIVPFLREPYRFYLMKPVARHQALGAPKFQICKGTRMMKTAGGWTDMMAHGGKAMAESLAATALREGIEELGFDAA